MIQKTIIVFLLMVPASQALAASGGPFISLQNTNFIVLIAFVLFVLAIIYFRAPQFAAKLIDGQIAKIQKRIDDAEKVQADARELLLTLEKKNTEASEHVNNVIKQARDDARLAIEQANSKIDDTVERRTAAAKLQIAAAESAAVEEIKKQAIDIAVDVAGDVINRSMSPEFRKKNIDRSIHEMETHLY